MAEAANRAKAVQTEKHPASPWSPLREPLFRSLWIAAVVSYTGTWMQNVGAGWLMTSLTMSPLMVGLVQAASSLPVFLVILPAGAFADLLDRRRILLATQTWMVLAAFTLGILTVLGLVTPWILLAFTFLLGVGAVMNDPAWQAITPEVVSPERFHAGVALNSVGFNVARAIGPALGGLVIAAWSTGAVFLLNAVSFAGVIWFLYGWKRRPLQTPPGASRMLPAIRIGLQYVRQTPAVKAVLVRTAVFSFSASALLALLPLIAHPFGSVGYGIMLGLFGLGALAGAAVIPACQRVLSMNKLVISATLLYSVALYEIGATSSFPLLAGALLLGGAGWITIVSSLNVSAQTSSPAWIRARMLSMYLLVLQGGVSAGSATWGALAARYGLGSALAIAAIALAAGVVTAKRFPLEAAALDLATPLES